MTHIRKLIEILEHIEKEAADEKTAFARGAAAMRELAAKEVDGMYSYDGRDIGDEIREMPLPESEG